jgi:hypothetical protein
MQNLISIDVGIRNLAICRIRTDGRILNWDVDGVPPESDKGLFPCLRDHLRKRPWLLDASTVIIEKQPDRNRKMKGVENFLHAYFVLNDIETVIWDARFKIPDISGPGKEMYRKRKKAAIDRCKAFIHRDELNEDWHDHFDASKKKDDLADTVMQALSFINRKTVTASATTKTGKPKKPKAKVVSRKPTENQKSTRYSKSNLAWFLKNKTKDAFKKDKRLMKDLKRYYSSLDELESAVN